mmetsp:Transcript_37727/g.121363  ORF Transcript_37727/g.121363 Transcript_37727/m.121363 type:complete len:213 (-) Transcript_37727:411-1049(-)
MGSGAAGSSSDNGGRQVRDESGPWGPYRITWVPPKPGGKFGAWQGVCPYHKLNSTTLCTKRLNLIEGESVEIAKSMIQGWLLQSCLHNRKRHHAFVHPRQLPMLPDPLLDAKLLRLPPAPDLGDLMDDDDLDNAESAEASRIARRAVGNADVRRRAKGKAKASGAAPSLAVVQLAAAPAAVDAAVPEGASSDDDNSSTTDSSSGSSSDSDSD